VDEDVRLFLVSPALAIRRALARALDAEPQLVVVGEARTSAQAVARVPAVRPDVVLASAHLTDPDSPEMCRLLRDGMAELQVLIVGVNAPLALVEAVVRAGAAGVVPHTIDEPELVEAIETVASGRTVMSTETLMTILRAESNAEDRDPLAHLSGLERELFYLVGEGLSNAEIAERLHLSTGTVRNYVSRLLRKLNVDRRAQVIALAARSPSQSHGGS
jgi:two-component system response regulator DevR